MKEERYRQLYRALAGLPPEQRTVLYLKYFEDMGASEIADIMQLNIRRVYKLTEQGKETSANKLQEGDWTLSTYTLEMKAGCSLQLQPMSEINGRDPLSAEDVKVHKAWKKYTDCSVSYLSLAPKTASVSASGKITVNKNAGDEDTALIYVMDASSCHSAYVTVTVK